MQARLRTAARYRWWVALAAVAAGIGAIIMRARSLSAQSDYLGTGNAVHVDQLYQARLTILAVLLAAAAVGLRLFMVWDKKVECRSCRKRVRREASTCPYCRTALAANALDDPGSAARDTQSVQQVASALGLGVGDPGSAPTGTQSVQQMASALGLAAAAPDLTDHAFDPPRAQKHPWWRHRTVMIVAAAVVLALSVSIGVVVSNDASQSGRLGYLTLSSKLGCTSDPLDGGLPDTVVAGATLYPCTTDASIAGSSTFTIFDSPQSKTAWIAEYGDLWYSNPHCQGEGELVGDNWVVDTCNLDVWHQALVAGGSPSHGP
jgi:hypothetical protein